MDVATLPTDKNWSDYDWKYVLDGDEFYEGVFSAYDGERVEDVTAARIARVDLWDADEADGHGSRDFVCLVELVDGTWATCMAWADTTGWGCRQGVMWKWTRTRDDAIRFGLDKDARRRLGVPLDGED
jgi:hypothetical protein